MDLRNVSWRTASRSKEDGSNCVELASASGLVAVRDSKDPDGGEIIMDRNDFRHITDILKNI